MPHVSLWATSPWVGVLHVSLNISRLQHFIPPHSDYQRTSSGFKLFSIYNNKNEREIHDTIKMSPQASKIIWQSPGCWPPCWQSLPYKVVPTPLKTGSSPPACSCWAEHVFLPRGPYLILVPELQGHNKATSGSIQELHVFLYWQWSYSLTAFVWLSLSRLLL